MPTPKDIPKCPPTMPAARDKGRESREYLIELITPMVGGGASPGEVDPRFPIRPTAIRGHLRHWWRLSCGYSHGTGMWRREEEIFGSTEFPSPLTVYVESPTEPVRFDPSDANVVDRFGPIAYALFAAIENNQRVSKEGINFTLRVQYANEAELTRRRAAQNEHRRRTGRSLLPSSIEPIANEVENAVNAWLTFGGIGGRTRRGCGAVHCRNLGNDFPKLPASVFVGPAQSSAIDAWKKALEAYRDFRQTPRGKVHQKSIQTRNGPKTIRVPGRSHWPEADSIRRISGCALKPPHGTPPSGVSADEDTRDHSTPIVPENLLPAFPKAVLGLPINFHFADGPGKGKATANLDPKDVQLYPVLAAENGRLEKAERMASPIITRPLWMNGKWLPAIIILNQTLPEGLQVRIEGQNASLTGDLLRDFPLSRVIDDSLGAIAPMRGKSCAINALIEFARSKGFEPINPTEVTR